MNAIDVHVDGELRALVARLRRRERIAHIPAAPRDSEDAAFAVQDRIHLIERDPLAPHDVREDGGIDAARARAHHKPLKRRESHRGVDRLAVVHRGDGSTVAEMTGDEAQIT